MHIWQTDRLLRGAYCTTGVRAPIRYFILITKKKFSIYPLHKINWRQWYALTHTPNESCQRNIGHFDLFVRIAGVVVLIHFSLSIILYFLFGSLSICVSDTSSISMCLFVSFCAKYIDAIFDDQHTCTHTLLRQKNQDKKSKWTENKKTKKGPLNNDITTDDSATTIYFSLWCSNAK